MNDTATKPDAAMIAWRRGLSAEFRRLGGGLEVIEDATKKRPVPEVVDFAAIPDGNQVKIGVATLLTLKETAARLKTTTNQVMGFVQDGKLIYINVGRGTVKPRYRFAETDIDDFEQLRRTREEPKSCLFSKSKARKTTVTIAGSTVIGLEELRRRRTAAKLKK